jgi:hypothetical protein
MPRLPYHLQQAAELEFFFWSGCSGNDVSAYCLDQVLLNRTQFGYRQKCNFNGRGKCISVEEAERRDFVATAAEADRISNDISRLCSASQSE